MIIGVSDPRSKKNPFYFCPACTDDNSTAGNDVCDKKTKD
jgi:hypothetical protein